MGQTGRKISPSRRWELPWGQYCNIFHLGFILVRPRLLEAFPFSQRYAIFAVELCDIWLNLTQGIAFQLVHISGLGSAKLHTKNSLKSEIKRRRLWACYLMQCQTAEQLSLFEPVADIPNLTLPWPDKEFDSRVSRDFYVTLSSGGNGGIYAEMIKALTLW